MPLLAKDSAGPVWCRRGENAFCLAPKNYEPEQPSRHECNAQLSVTYRNAQRQTSPRQRRLTLQNSCRPFSACSILPALRFTWT